jgi:hypothetical protein
MACDCLENANKLLAEHNTKLSETIALSCDRSEGYVTVTLVTEKIAPRGKRPVVMAPTFCPLCGERYRPEAAAVEGNAGAQVSA